MRAREADWTRNGKKKTFEFDRPKTVDGEDVGKLMPVHTLTLIRRPNDQVKNDHWEKIFKKMTSPVVLIIDGCVMCFPPPDKLENLKELKFVDYRGDAFAQVLPVNFQLTDDLHSLSILGETYAHIGEEATQQLLNKCKTKKSTGEISTLRVEIEHCSQKIAQHIIDREIPFDELKITFDNHEIVWSEENGNMLSILMDDDTLLDETMFREFSVKVEIFELNCKIPGEKSPKFCTNNKLNPWWNVIHQHRDNLWALALKGVKDEDKFDTFDSDLKIAATKLPQLLVILVQVVEQKFDWKKKSS